MLKKINNPSTFGVIAPAFPADEKKIQSGIYNLQKDKHKIISGEAVYKKHLYFAGTDKERAADLNNMFKDKTLEAILCARGGWGSLRLLDKIDYKLIARHPKLLIGYSDITFLQLAIWHKCAVPSLSGPMLATDFAGQPDPFTMKHFWNQIYNTNDIYEYRVTEENTEIWNPGSAEGVLVGGCLSMIVHLLGTPYSPDYADKILFIEDVGDAPYKVDRNLSQLKQAGILDSIRGLIIGRFENCEAEDNLKDQVTTKIVLQDYFSTCPYPVLYNFPYGHSTRKFTLPIGVKGRLDLNEKIVVINNIFS
ncbi:MAG: LD-carboxypeptidase [Calditrichaceae bacterium]|nr:LD-carboxypeptidase [Calditrichaceae bacterium]